MSQQEIRAKLDAAVEYLKGHPAEARYADSPAVARLADAGALKVDVTGVDGEHISTDMPLSVGGGASAPSAGWYLRAAEAACVATLIGMRAAHEGVVFEGLEVRVDSDSDDRGILGISDTVPAGPLRTRVRVRVREMTVDDDDDSIWDSIVNWAVDHCPVTDAVRRAVPMTVQIVTDEDQS